MRYMLCWEYRPFALEADFRGFVPAVDCQVEWAPIPHKIHLLILRIL